MNNKAVLYARVSMDDLHNENQERILVSRAKQEKWSYDFFSEKQTTRKTRPVKEKVMGLLRNGDYNILAFARLDRFARSMMELVMDIQELISKGINVVVVQQGFNWNKKSFHAVDKLQLQLLSAFAEFEREMIRERTLEGLARARAQGKTLGRPKGSKDTKIRRKSGYLLRWKGKSPKTFNQ